MFEIPVIRLRLIYFLFIFIFLGCGLINPSADSAEQDAPALSSDSPRQIELQRIVGLGTQITYLTHAGDGTGRIFILERRGKIRILGDGEILEEPFLDISEWVDSASMEQGLLGLAFDPEYALNGEFYVNYTTTNPNDDTIVARFKVSSDPNIADPASQQVVLHIPQPANNHNGGQILFDPSGYLMIGMGDGGRGNDPWENAENLNSLLGKILRLDVRGEDTYQIPLDNPFRDRSGVRPEVWAYGLRNPWRFSFDRDTGDLFIGDVGQNKWEEINLIAAGSEPGQNLGWNTLEGTHCFDPAEGCDRAGKLMPIAEYSHVEDCSVTGGYVYRGSAFPQLIGTYFFSDWCSGRIWGLQQDPNGDWWTEELLDTELSFASFGEDENGEIYILDMAGDVYQIKAVP